MKLFFQKILIMDVKEKYHKTVGLSIKFKIKFYPHLNLSFVLILESVFYT